MARERKSPQGKNLRVFCLETLKNFILNDKFYLKMTAIMAFFLHIRALFPNFQKRAGETSPPSSYAPEHVRKSFYKSLLNLAFPWSRVTTLNNIQKYFSLLDHQLAKNLILVFGFYEWTKQWYKRICNKIVGIRFMIVLKSLQHNVFSPITWNIKP